VTEPAPGLRQTLTWKGGFWLALVIPMSGLTLVGYEIGALGAWGALAVWLGTSVIALLQNFIYSELAGIYPEASGGIAVYASRIWGRYFAPLGGILGWGYWAGWSLTLAVVSLVIGDLVQAQWFPADTGTITVLGNHVGLPTWIAAGVVIVVYLINVSGLKLVIATNVVIAAALAILAGVCIIGPIAAGDLHGSLHFTAGHGTWTIIVTLLTWGFVASWTSYGTEIAAAVLLLVFNLFMIVIGFTHPALIGYGGGTEQLIALSVIVVGLASYFFTRRVQLGVRGRRLWQDDPDNPTRPSVSVTAASAS
jgi:amino acid transporter